MHSSALDCHICLTVINCHKDFPIVHNYFKVHFKSKKFQYDYSLEYCNIQNDHEFSSNV